MQGSKLWRGFVLGWVVLVGVGCWALLSHDARATGGVRDPAALRRIILEAVPVGRPVDAAWDFLEGEGFKSSYQVARPGREDVDPHELRFTRSDMHWDGSADVFESVRLIERDGRVADVRARFDRSD